MDKFFIDSMKMVFTTIETSLNCFLWNNRLIEGRTGEILSQMAPYIERDENQNNVAGFF